jgi:septal ring factor EnvC (AmiA/AmiB activator)
MEIVEAAKINSFASPAEHNVPPVEESIFVLTASQAVQAVKEAIKPLKDELEDLKATINDQATELAALKATANQQTERIAALEEEKNILNVRLDKHREWIDELRTVKGLQPKQRDNGKTLRAILAVNNGKMFSKTARQQMHLSRSQFSKLLSTMKDQIEIKPCQLKGKRNQNLLILKSKLVSGNKKQD